MSSYIDDEYEVYDEVREVLDGNIESGCYRLTVDRIKIQRVVNDKTVDLHDVVLCDVIEDAVQHRIDMIDDMMSVDGGEDYHPTERFGLQSWLRSFRVARERCVVEPFDEAS